MSDVVVYAILCNFMRVFSAFWKLSVRDNDQKKTKNIHGVGKAHCMLSFLSGGETQSSERSERENF